MARVSAKVARAKRAGTFLAKPRRKAATRRPRVKATTRLIKQVLNRELETKYAAQNVHPGGKAISGSFSPNTDYIPIVADVAFQTGAAVSNQREGDVIKPVRASVKGHIWFNPLNEIQASAKIVFVKMFILQSKTVKSATLAANLDNGWLEDGSPNPVQWTSSTLDFQAFYPVAKQNYTVLKTQTFKFVKNVGICIADNTAGNSPNTEAMDRKTFSYSWVPPTLKYANDAQNQPSNHFPFMVLVAYAPGLDVDANADLTDALLYDYRREIYYKDA